MAEQLLTIASFIAALGGIIKLFSYLNRTENGVFACYATGQVLISIAIAMTLTIALLVLKHLYKDTFALIDTFGATCLGLVLATFVTHIVYKDTDKFFTNIEQVQTKTFIINLLQAVLFLLLLIFKWVRRIVLTDNLGGQENIIVADPDV